MKIEFLSEKVYELRDFDFRGLYGKRYVVFDIEATGPDPDDDSVIQIGAVSLTGPGLCPTPPFSTLVKPWKPIPEKISELTGITNDRVADASSLARVWSDFSKFCTDAVLVTQCGYEFDYPLLDRECNRTGLPRLKAFRLDTKAIFAILHPEIPNTFSTNFLTDYYGIDRSPFKRHDALGDAELIARILVAELGDARQLGIDAFTTERILINRFVLPPL